MGKPWFQAFFEVKKAFNFFCNILDKSLRESVESEFIADNTELFLETALKHKCNLKVVNERLDKLKTEITTSSQRRKTQGSMRSTVIKVLGGKNSVAYKDQSINKGVFSSCYN